MRGPGKLNYHDAKQKWKYQNHFSSRMGVIIRSNFADIAFEMRVGPQCWHCTCFNIIQILKTEWMVKGVYLVSQFNVVTFNVIKQSKGIEIRIVSRLRCNCWIGSPGPLLLTWLTHWGRNKMAAVFQTKFWNRFYWMKIYEFRLQFHWSLFLGVQSTIFQHCFR